MQLALAYNDALLTGKLSCTNGGIIQSTFIESLRKRIEGIMSCSKDLKGNFFNYLFTEKLSTIHSDKEKMDAALLSWYLLWYNIPPPHIVKSAMEKIKRKAPMRLSAVPLLQLLLPTTHSKGIAEITDILYNSCVFGLQRAVM